MASELRWILAALSALLLLGIWWWGVRRSRQSPGNAHLREPNAGPAIMGPTIMGPTIMGPTLAHDTDEAESREWGVPPFEPLNIHTADFDQEPAMDLPMTATAAPLDVMLNMDFGSAEPEEVAEPLLPAATAPPLATAQPVPAAPPAPAAQPMPAAQPAATAHPAATEAVATTVAPVVAPAPVATAPNTSEMQRIVTVRVCALGDQQWPGAELLAALESHGLGYGRYKVFHRKHSDGRTLFCAASLVEPGTFDIARMSDEHFRGLTLFAVLPGPADALETIDTLIATAVDLADTLQGAVQDAKGAPLSAQRAEALRADVARFQQSLSMS